jgi:hypothetical protein
MEPIDDRSTIEQISNEYRSVPLKWPNVARIRPGPTRLARKPMGATSVHLLAEESSGPLKSKIAEEVTNRLPRSVDHRLSQESIGNIE